MLHKAYGWPLEEANTRLQADGRLEAAVSVLMQALHDERAKRRSESAAQFQPPDTLLRRTSNSGGRHRSVTSSNPEVPRGLMPTSDWASKIMVSLCA
jgi:hypothetical protein